MRDQTDLFGDVPEVPAEPTAPRASRGGDRQITLPEGFRYQPALFTLEDEAAIVARIAELPLKEFQFHGYTGKRRVVSFGWKYDFEASRLLEGAEVPDFLLAVRERAADFAGLQPAALQQVLVTEYGPGSAIGWHKDKAVFDEVVGVSLLSACTFRLRRRAGDGWERVNLIAEPRSAYLLSGVARTEWEHSIPPVESLRYSITFRSLRAG
jgi:alkylated DNA repair dioxygenase AlkB